ncbi:hypothetical protein ANCCAN_12014 [Ancylostoma caninum]|uniref:Uncharacterized protein n=1 Tax=Ancylostoma caninum TaxID=29170 RepID=A0A368GCA4_ANCCA|nr:hypothetical protein ANCCAN_12014 [Ancylostoma caninum]
MFKVFIVTAFFGTFAYIWLLVIWKGNKANLEDELEMADKGKPSENLDVNLKRYASQLSVQPDGTRIIGELPKPSIEFVRSLSRDVGRTYPSLSLEDQAKILAYRLDNLAIACTTAFELLGYSVQLPERRISKGKWKIR